MERVLAVPEDLSGAEDPRAERVPAGQQAGAHRVHEASSRPGRARPRSPNKLLGGWRAVDKKWFDPNGRASCSRSSSRSESRPPEYRARHRGAAPSARRPSTAGREPPRRLSPCRWVSSRRSSWSSSCCRSRPLVWKSTGERLVRLLGGRLLPGGRRGVQADARSISTLAVLTTAVFGTIIAWVLVRDSFAGKSVVNAIIDLPFALPTIVAGLVIMALYGPRTPLDFTIGSFHFDANVTFTRGAIYIALLFVTLPFVVRSVQPVLIEFDRELEDAARSLGARPVRDLPARRAAGDPPRDPLRGRDGIRARRRRDRRDRPDRRQPPVQDRGRLDLPLLPHRAETPRARLRSPSCCS